MNRLALIVLLILVSTGTWGDFSCPDGTSAVCMENGDSICPGTARCVSNDVVCLDKNSCAGGNFICDTGYDELMRNYKKAVAQYDELVSENVSLREQRLARKNCVLNASSLEESQKCVR